MLSSTNKHFLEAYLRNMAKDQAPHIKSRIRKEGEAMNMALKKAARKATKEAFARRKTLLVERDGWLVCVNAEGRVTKRVRPIEPVTARQ